MNRKKTLKVPGFSAITFVLVLFGGGMLLDGTIELKTESTLDAPPEIVQHAAITSATAQNPRVPLRIQRPRY